MSSGSSSSAYGPSRSLDRLRNELEALGHSQAVLSHPETLARLGCFEEPVEDWPVSNPFVAVPALLCLGPRDAVLVVADFHVPDVRECGARVVTYRSYDFKTPPDPAGELRIALIQALDDVGISPGPTGIEAMHLPYEVADWLQQAGLSPVGSDTAVASAARAARVTDLDAIRRACRLADVVQQAIKDHAAPGVSEAELAGLGAAAMFREAGR
jgi:Xaa-Pro aminopeptidase